MEFSDGNGAERNMKVKKKNEKVERKIKNKKKLLSFESWVRGGFV
jgi:hypothetical protein